ncbi:hypothetical protein MNBD_BACTEROID05-217 [hydrothermal vent metagenome]|uniref:TonB-dependent receptor-like beta-barrel domain-containing protein n=1 Tax=hydrothermal vent metagenome TaxID=652676 RepID=A0A3B0U202_9ZZZZ
MGSTVKPQVKLTSSFGEFSTIKDSLEFSGKVGKVGYYFSGDFYKTDGQFSLTDVERKNVFAKWSFPLAENMKLTGLFGYNGASILYGQPSSATFSSQPYIARYGKISLDIDNPGYKITADLKYNDQNITTDIFKTSSRSNISSTVSHDFYKGISLIGLFDIREDDQLVFGIDLDRHTLKSSRFLDSSKTINMQAPFMNYTLNLRAWSLISGVRYDRNQRFGSQTSPSLGAVYRFEDSHHSLVRVKISRAFNAPPLLWIFNNDPSLFVGANPNLKAERAMAYELGYETKPFEHLFVKLNAYRSDVKNAIGLVFDADNSVFIQKNFKRFRRQGGELLLKYAFNPQWSFYGSGAFNDVKNRQTNKIVRDAGIARQRFKFGMNYRTDDGWGLNLSGYYNRWSSSSSLLANDRKPTFDMKLTKKFKNIKKDIGLQAFLNIYNLTNSKYWAINSLPLPGRYFEGGFSVQF